MPLALVTAAAAWWALRADRAVAGASTSVGSLEGPGVRLALVITGESRPTSTEQALVLGLTRGGVPAMVLLAGPGDATPASAADQADAALRDMIHRFHREHIVLVGFGRGAGMAPFVANRIGGDLRARLDLLVLAGLEPRVNFRQRRRGWTSRQPRPTDWPVIPELERLRGLPILCIESARDSAAGFCGSLGAGLVRRAEPLPPADPLDGAAAARRVLAYLQ